MNGKYDAASKDLVEVEPADLLTILGQARPPERVRTIDADLSTVATTADKVIWVDDPQPWILHSEFHTYWDSDLPFSVNARNALLQKRHRVSVASVIFLLRRGADGSNLTGTLRSETPIAEPSDFHYKVVRVWKLPPESVLTGPLSFLPYAPLCGVKETELPAIIERMNQRITGEANPLLAGKLWAATFILMGLQFEEETIKQIQFGANEMRESVTYQAILREGEAKGEAKGEANEARKMLVLVGSERFGPPDNKISEKLAAINEVSRLEGLGVRLFKVDSWQELLAEK